MKPGKAEAFAKARALQKRMRGGPWRISVWHTNAWHYALRMGSLNLYPTNDGECCDDSKYFCLMSDTHGDSGGLPAFTEDYTYRDPNKAVAKQIKVARRYVNKLDKVVLFVEDRVLMPSTRLPSGRH
jgi:hypothetical protein